MNKRRRGALSVIMPWMRRFGFILLTVFFGVWLGVWLLVSGGFGKAGDYVQEKLITASASMGFKIENVLIEGRVYTDPEVLKSLIDVEKGTPLFALEPAAVRARIEQVQWIRSAIVQRRLPDTVFIRILEHKPLALWQQGGSLHLLDEEGKAIQTPHLSPFKNLMIVMGEEAPAHAPALLADLEAEPALAPHITSAKWIDNRRWDLETKEGVTVKLPEGEVGLALRRLAEAQTQDKILQKDVTEIDLREPARIIVRTRPGALQEFTASAAKGDNI